MTCIIAYKTATKLYMGADSCGFRDDTDTRVFTTPKVFKAGKILCGYTSTYRFGQILERYLKGLKPAPKEPVKEWLFENLIPGLIEELKKHTYLEIKDGEAWAATFILGIKGRIFRIHADFSITERACTYEVCGSGELYAVGVLAALDGAPNWTPKAKILHALKITAEHCPSVREPFIIIEEPSK